MGLKMCPLRENSLYRTIDTDAADYVAMITIKMSGTLYEENPSRFSKKIAAVLVPGG